MTTYAVVDLEATKDSLTNEQHIIQIGITFIENDTISDTLTIDIKPPVAISQTITQLTGITNSQVACAPTFEEVSDYIATVLDGCVFVAHNSVFDYNLLAVEYERLNQELVEMICVDTLELAKIILPTQTLYGLKTLTNQYGITLENHHHAGEDSHATALLFLALTQDINRLSASTCEKIFHLLQSKQDAMAFLFENKGNVNNCLVELTTRENIVSKDQTFMILDETQTFEKTYVSYREFVDEGILDYLIHHGQELSIQESRLLAKVCVYLEQSNGGHLLPLRLPQKFMQRIQSYDVSNRHYLAYLTYLKTQQTVYFTTYDFVTDYQLLQQHFELSQITLRILGVQDWIKQSRLALTQTFPLSNWIYHLFSIKNKHIINNQPVDLLDNAIGQLFGLLDSIREQLPTRLENDIASKNREHYLGNIASEWVERLSNILQSIEQALNKPYKTNYEEWLTCLRQQTAFSDYASVRVQAHDFSIRYTLQFQPFSTQKWFDEVVMVDFKSVGFDDLWIAHKALQTYFKVMVSQKITGPENLYPQLPNVYVHTDKNAQNWKDNLLVKKIVQFCAQQTEKTLVIVPNQTLLVEIKDAGVMTIDDVFQGHLIDKYDVVVTTWKVVYSIRNQLHPLQKICLVKLPFEYPDSMQQQSSKYFLPARVTYFSNIDLITVLLDLLVMMKQLSTNTRFEVWDNRFIHSAYAKKIADIFKDSVKIVEE